MLPGDRIFIAQDNWIALDSWVNRVTAPFERLFGFTLLGSQTIQTMNRFPLGQTCSNRHEGFHNSKRDMKMLCQI